ncbi:threonylcarbamoyl-AMP synthase [Candidatus Poribacteria bacterium]|nr:threonylcarbamoyl-AMP synthase [Candidatus Poribacteria bacterium]
MPKYFYLTDNEIFFKNKQEIFQLIQDGKVGIFPTDTVYGIGVKASLKDAFERIYIIKNRPQNKQIPLVVGSWDEFNKITEHCNISESVKKLMQKWLPGPLTIVVEIDKGKTIALRLPAHQILCEIIESIGEPLALTSANLSGDKSPKNFKEISSSIIDKVDFIIDTGECKYKEESTIIDWQGNILREGAIKSFLR